MKRERQQTLDKPGQVLCKWAAALSLGLISVQASAFEGGYLQATDLIAAARELATTMGYQDSCQLVELHQSQVEDESSPGLHRFLAPSRDRFFTMQCPDQKFLLKYRLSSSKDPSSPLTLEQLKERMPAEQSARLLQPVAEFSFDEQGEGQGFYKVYTWTQSTSLRNWVSDFGKSASGCPTYSDLVRRKKIFQQVSSLVAAATRAALVPERQQQVVSPSQSRQNIVTGLNLWVTPEDEVIGFADAIAPVSDSELFNEIMLAQVPVFGHEYGWGSFTEATNPGHEISIAADGFDTGYCKAFECQNPDDSGPVTNYCNATCPPYSLESFFPPLENDEPEASALQDWFQDWFQAPFDAAGTVVASWLKSLAAVEENFSGATGEEFMSTD